MAKYVTETKGISGRKKKQEFLDFIHNSILTKIEAKCADTMQIANTNIRKFPNQQKIRFILIKIY